MPGYAVKPCTYPGCHALVRDGSGRCEKHPKKPWVHRDDAAPRMRGRKLQQARRRLFRDNPLCAPCERNGKTTLATERGHIIALSDDGEDTEENTEPQCHACNVEQELRDRAKR